MNKITVKLNLSSAFKSMLTDFLNERGYTNFQLETTGLYLSLIIDLDQAVLFELNNEEQEFIQSCTRHIKAGYEVDILDLEDDSVLKPEDVRFEDEFYNEGEKNEHGNN